MISKDASENEIQNILEQLTKVYHPQKVILFGSILEGIIKDGSDIDLFIIKEDISYLGVDRMRELDAMIKYRYATDFIVYKPEEVTQRFRVGDPFIKNIPENGKVLYDAGRSSQGVGR